MASCVQSVRRAIKVKDFIKALLHQRFFTARSASFTKGSFHAKRAKPASIQWNSVTGPRNETPLHTSTAEFHHLAEHLIFNTVYITNNGIRNFAKGTDEVPSLEQYMKTVKNVDDNDRFEKEKQRLKRKGVMRDIKVKIPEGVINAKL